MVQLVKIFNKFSLANRCVCHVPVGGEGAYITACVWCGCGCGCGLTVQDAL